MKIIQKKLLIGLPVLFGLMFVLSAGLVMADTPSVPDTDLPDVTVEDVLTNAVNWIAGIVALVSALVIAVAGVRWAMASGDQDLQDGARKMLMAGIIGLVIALAAIAIVRVFVDIVF